MYSINTFLYYTSKFFQELFVVENFLPIALVITIAFSLIYPEPGIYCKHIQYQGTPIIEFANNVLVFLISGLTLKLEELSHVIEKHKLTIAYGIITINFVTTLLALILVQLPFHTPEFAVGLTIFATVPATLGVGVALTQISKGDHILSLFLTVSSNMIGIITVPFLLKYYLSGGLVKGVADIQVSALAEHLTLGVMIPTLTGITIRYFLPFIPSLTTTYRVQLSMFSTSNLLMIVWMALSASRHILFQQSFYEIFGVFLAVLCQHFLYLLGNYLVAGPNGLDLPLPQLISIVLMASQKSNPVGLAVITSLPVQNAQKGLFALPCLMGQLIQIFIGSYLAKYFYALMNDYEKVMILHTMRKASTTSLTTFATKRTSSTNRLRSFSSEFMPLTGNTSGMMSWYGSNNSNNSNLITETNTTTAAEEGLSQQEQQQQENECDYGGEEDWWAMERSVDDLDEYFSNNNNNNSDNNSDNNAGDTRKKNMKKSLSAALLGNVSKYKEEDTAEVTATLRRERSMIFL